MSFYILRLGQNKKPDVSGAQDQIILRNFQYAWINDWFHYMFIDFVFNIFFQSFWFILEFLGPLGMVKSAIQSVHMLCFIIGAIRIKIQRNGIIVNDKKWNDVLFN